MRPANASASRGRGGCPLLLLLPALWLGSCAAGMSSSRTPSSPAQGREELAQLEGEIATDRVALGLPPRAEEKTATAADQSAHGGAEAFAPAPSASPPPPAAPAERAAVNSAAGGAAKEDVCTVDPCRYTRAICAAATRICDIARYLGDEDARGRCGRAQQDCSEARRVTRDNCPGC